MTRTIDDWQSFLARWSQEWADAQDEEPLRPRWLGFPPASEERIRALEERLGLRLPPSYRSFLAATDGWRHAGGFVWLLAGTDQVRRHEDAAGLSEYFPGELDGSPTPEEELLAGMWGRALQLDVESDMVYVLLDPGDVDDAGEWAVYTWASWRASPPERYASFRAFMEAMHREFHSLQVDIAQRAGRVFVNETTQALDASVEAARLDALGGRYEHASAVLAEAIAYGRPRASALRDQIRHLLGQTYSVSFHGLAADPLYAPELVPVLAAQHVRHRRDESSFSQQLAGAPETVRSRASEALRQAADGTFRHTSEGPFGRAVEAAREQARWGDTDAAWHTLRAALSHWRPLGPEHLAPVGLTADPILGPVLTPDRGRELLATPRAGQPGEAPTPAADQDPAGMAWLADGDPGNFLVSYRFLLVEGVEPAELPALVGAEDGTALNEPTTLWDAARRFRRERDGSAWADEALTAVGRAGAEWSFAFEPGPGAGFDERRFVCPGIPASRGTRAVTVWSEPVGGVRRGLFHLSVAENGEESYAITVRGGAGAISSRGNVPAGLDPARLFAEHGLDEERLGERRALEALAAEFDVRLPRFALARGRLHTFRTRPWNRPPAPGEGYVAVSFVRHRATWP
ncbi:SMI1/KNR4 family protein [Streptomyces sp. NPDC005648]|uniref:SMI1/KNR4 family protein n=1 Tax=Streptomyces sp. NPDC005648 TaxID=3157044 RepID=UPI0033BB54EF